MEKNKYGTINFLRPAWAPCHPLHPVPTTHLSGGGTDVLHSGPNRVVGL